VRGELRIARMQLLEIVAREWVLLDRDEMQPLAALRVFAPGKPGSEEVQAETEAGLEDREDAPALPALRQPVAAEKNVPSLPRPAFRAVVDVAKFLGTRRAVRRESEPRGNDAVGSGSYALPSSIRTSRCGIGITMPRARNASSNARLRSLVARP